MIVQPAVEPMDRFAALILTCAGSINLLEVMQSHSVTRLVFSSSATVYGQVSSLELQTKVHTKVRNHGEVHF